MKVFILVQFQIFSLQLLNIKSFKGILQDLRWLLLLFYKTHFISCFCFYILYDIICCSLLCSLLFYSEIGVLQNFFCLVKVQRLQLKTFKIPLKALILVQLQVLSLQLPEKKNYSQVFFQFVLPVQNSYFVKQLLMAASVFCDIFYDVTLFFSYCGWRSNPLHAK